MTIDFFNFHRYDYLIIILEIEYMVKKIEDYTLLELIGGGSYG